MMLSNCGAGETLESPLDCKEIKTVNPKGNQHWIFIWRTDTEAPILWPPDVRSWLTGKDHDAGKDGGQEKGPTEDEDEMVGWHHRVNGHEYGQTLGDSEGQGRLACCSPWGHNESNMNVTEQQSLHVAGYWCIYDQPPQKLLSVGIWKSVTTTAWGCSPVPALLSKSSYQGISLAEPKSDISLLWPRSLENVDLGLQDCEIWRECKIR